MYIDGYYKYIDKKGRFLNDDKYIVAFDFYDGVARVRKKDMGLGFIDIQGRFYSYKVYRNIPVNKYLIIQKNGKYGYMNIYDESKNINPIYDSVSSFHDKMALVKIKDKVMLIDNNSKTITESHVDFDSLKYYYDGYKLLNYKIDSHSVCHYSNVHGENNIIINAKKCKDYSDSVAVVKMEHDYILIDTKGKIINHLNYSYIHDYKNGYAVFQEGDKMGVVDKNGNILIEPIYEYVSDVSDDKTFLVKTAKSWIIYMITK